MDLTSVETKKLLKEQWSDLGYSLAHGFRNPDILITFYLLSRDKNNISNLKIFVYQNKQTLIIYIAWLIFYTDVLNCKHIIGIICLV